MKNKVIYKISVITMLFLLLFGCFTTNNSFIQSGCFKGKLSPLYCISNGDEFIFKEIKNFGLFLVKIGSRENFSKTVSANFSSAPVIPVSEIVPETTVTVNKENPPDIKQPVEKTISSSAGNVNAGNFITIGNQTSYKVDIKALSEKGIPFSVHDNSSPQVLIIHTHGTESYTPSEKYNFTYSETTRSTNPAYNVVRIGKEVSELLNQAGINVIHDVTMYDYPEYNSSYDKAFYGIKAMLKKYPSIQIVLDIHRDAVNTETGETVKLVCDVKGEKAAQIMFVVGTDECGFSHPNWEYNLKFASIIQKNLYKINPSLVRPINLRTSRFNQHFTKGSLIVEVGTNGNTLDEALVSAKYLAEAIKETIEYMK